MSELLVDANVLVFARGTAHPYRDPCRRLVHAVAEGSVALHASVELVQEFAHLLLRRGGDRAGALEEVEEVRSMCQLHDFDVEVWNLAAEFAVPPPVAGSP